MSEYKLLVLFYILENFSKHLLENGKESIIINLHDPEDIDEWSDEDKLEMKEQNDTIRNLLIEVYPLIEFKNWPNPHLDKYKIQSDDDSDDDDIDDKYLPNPNEPKYLQNDQNNDNKDNTLQTNVKKEIEITTNEENIEELESENNDEVEDEELTEEEKIIKLQQIVIDLESWEDSIERFNIDE